MEWPLVVVLLTSGFGFVMIGVSNLIYYTILCDVNAKSPEGQQTSVWKAGIRSYSLLRRHRDFSPESKKRSQMAWLTAVGSVLFVGALIGGIIATNMHWLHD